MLTLKHEWSGAEWLEKNLEAACSLEAKRRGKKRAISETISPFGRAVADLLGFVWRGLYHLPDESLIKAEWHSDRWITIKLYKGHNLATYDFAELSWLVVASHDLMIRTSVHAEFGGALVLGFSPRSRTGDVGRRLPLLEDHIAGIRKLYEVVEQDAAVAPADALVDEPSTPPGHRPPGHHLGDAHR